MKRITLSAHNVDDAAAAVTEFLQEGGVVVMPMDTSYGIAADAASATAVEQVFALKQRQRDPLSVIVADLAMAERYASFNPRAKHAWQRFLPGPVTLVLPVLEGQALAAAGPASSLGVRQPDYPLTQAVAERFGRPYTATSANRSGQPPAFQLDEFLSQLPEEGLRPQLVVDAGTLLVGPSSTVIDLSGPELQILREGVISAADIRAALS